MQYLIWGVIAYLIVINLVTFIVFGVDKAKARNHSWRIPEKTLFLLAIIGGSVGAILGMYTFRHKTRKWYFVIGMPFILIIQLAGAWFFGAFQVASDDTFPTAIESQAPAPTENSDTLSLAGIDDAEEPLSIDLEDIPDYDGSDEVVFNYNEPTFTETEKETN